ncbi:hypothetical protein HYS29_02520 [Candidatus Microgenomates bacterium]|nr:hypothetical protein [Candidatus Microgenomates bacterium]MBI2622280.1 hypothetical protein [Candidatus Microgenomates bacterium]
MPPKHERAANALVGRLGIRDVVIAFKKAGWSHHVVGDARTGYIAFERPEGHDGVTFRETPEGESCVFWHGLRNDEVIVNPSANIVTGPKGETLIDVKGITPRTGQLVEIFVNT